MNQEIDFDRDVKPIFAKHCVSCHGPEKQKNGLRLDRKADASGRRLGRRSYPVSRPRACSFNSSPGRTRTGRCRRRDRSRPRRSRRCKAWIDQGAKWPDDGSTPQPGRLVVVQAAPAKPPSRKFEIRSTKSETPSTDFILAKLSEKGLSPSPEADRRTLIRRLYFDLIGLPPTPEEVDAFVDERRAGRVREAGRPAARVAAVRRALGAALARRRPLRRDARLRQGQAAAERLAVPRLRHPRVQRRQAVRAVRAGADRRRRALPRHGRRHRGARLPRRPGRGTSSATPRCPRSKIDGKVARHLDRDDMVSNTIGTFLSLTVHCAQCHNHKFDPIPQEDYYRLQAVFAAIDRTDKQYDADPKITARCAELQRLYAGLSATLGVAAAEPIPAFAGRAAAASCSLCRRHSHRQRHVRRHRGQRRKTAPDSHSAARRRDEAAARKSAPGAIAAIPGINGRFELPPNHTEGDRRAALAKWLTDANNPLTWRVMVNRVWQYHFGRGLVDTPNDFGKMGQLPTHPELLDWLAAEFRDTSVAQEAPPAHRDERDLPAGLDVQRREREDRCRTTAICGGRTGASSKPRRSAIRSSPSPANST